MNKYSAQVSYYDSEFIVKIEANDYREAEEKALLAAKKRLGDVNVAHLDIEIVQSSKN